jgi:hypothetical protein
MPTVQLILNNGKIITEHQEHALYAFDGKVYQIHEANPLDMEIKPIHDNVDQFIEEFYSLDADEPAMDDDSWWMQDPTWWGDSMYHGE